MASGAGVLAAAAGGAGGLRAAAEAARARAGALVAAVRGADPGLEVVRLMDELSDCLCGVMDVAELLRNAAGCRGVAAEAHGVYGGLHHFINELNTDVALYDQVRASRAALPDRGAEAFRVADSLVADFERAGVHLAEGGRARATGLQDRILALESKFYGNLTDGSLLGSVALSPAEARTLPPAVRSAAPNLVLPTTLSVADAVARYSTLPALREKVFREAHRTPVANKGLLEEIIQLRRQHAELVGFESYAHFAVGQQLARHPAAVTGFLEEVLQELRPAADAEAEELRRFKERHGGGAGGLRPWDRPFYVGQFKASRCDLDARRVAEYLSLRTSLTGLALVLKRLMDIDVVVHTADAGLWADGLVRLELGHGGEPLGDIYLDLAPRPGKFPHSAHFTIQCGRQAAGGAYRQAVVAVVCSFENVTPNARMEDLLLLPSHLETLFHEVGHALHSLLSRTDFQHLSGTRGPMDFVEVPAKVFEAFATDPRVVGLFARHHVTGEPMPAGMLRALQRSRRLLPALDAQLQAAYALMDQRYFSQAPPRLGEAAAFNALTSIPHPDGALWELRFSHLMGYGAIYYSYLYAQSFAAEIWQGLLRNDPLSPVAGCKLWGLLRGGSAADFPAVLREAAGQGSVRPVAGGLAPSARGLVADVTRGAGG